MHTETLPAPRPIESSFHYGAAITIPAPPELVWSIVSDYAHDSEWREGVFVRPEPLGPSRDGTRTFESLRLFGDVHRVVARVDDVVAGSSLRFRGEDGLVEGRRCVTPVDGGTRFDIDVDVRLRGPVSLFAPLLSAHFDRRVKRDLVRLAAVVNDVQRWHDTGIVEPLVRSYVPTALGPLRVQRIGSSGPVVVLWHSAFLDARCFWPLAASIGKGRTLLLIDGPGHGGSPGMPGRFTLDDCADAALDVLDHFGVASADFVGHAWGGHVGVTLAARRTARIRRLVAISSPLSALRPSERVRACLAAAAMGIAGMDAVRSVVLETMLGDIARASRPDVVDYVSGAIVAQGRKRAIRTVRSALLGRPSLVERLGAIEVATLLVATDDDPTWPVDEARAQASRLRRGDFTIIAGARHLPLLEAPEGTVDAVGSWLAA
jgi:pimeloyl-ACP methyl ester carboxylesterase